MPWHIESELENKPSKNCTCYTCQLGPDTETIIMEWTCDATDANGGDPHNKNHTKYEGDWSWWRPKMRWLDGLKSYMRIYGFNPEMDIDKERWFSQVEKHRHHLDSWKWKRLVAKRKKRKIKVANATHFNGVEHITWRLNSFSSISASQDSTQRILRYSHKPPSSGICVHNL